MGYTFNDDDMTDAQIMQQNEMNRAAADKEENPSPADKAKSKIKEYVSGSKVNARNARNRKWNKDSGAMKSHIDPSIKMDPKKISAADSSLSRQKRHDDFKTSKIAKAKQDIIDKAAKK